MANTSTSASGKPKALSLHIGLNAVSPAAYGGWSGDLTGTTNPATVNVTKNMNITATFAQSFTITTSANRIGISTRFGIANR
jgi:hypothetical protein